MNRALAREMDDFGRLLFGHLARFHEGLVEVTLHRGTQFRTEVAATALALCWRDREMFQPPEESWLVWFNDHLDEAVRLVDKGGLQLRAEELALINRLGRERLEIPRRLFTTDPTRYDRAVAREAQSTEPSYRAFWFGKRSECPPCWKCRWFDGWLPSGDVPVVQYRQPEITEACANIDRRKVEIAQRVREGL